MPDAQCTKKVADVGVIDVDAAIGDDPRASGDGPAATTAVGLRPAPRVSDCNASRVTTMNASQITELTATVAVRVPRDDGENLVENARRRLERAEAVEAVHVEEMCGIEPALAATVVQLEVVLDVEFAVDEPTVRDELVETPGTERVERLQPA